MNDEDFLRKGYFTKNELSNAIFGRNYLTEYAIFQKVSNSLDWILDACVEDKEMERTGDQLNPIYRIKGNGIHYFTLTKQHLKNEYDNKNIQRQQVAIQRRMVFLTALLVFGTFLSLVDKIDEILKIWNQIFA